MRQQIAGKMTDIEEPRSNLPLSEQYRLVALKFVDADAAAKILEELKTARLSEMIGDAMRQDATLAYNKAEGLVKSSRVWQDYITGMVNARKLANRLKLQLEYIRMKHSEWMSSEATTRVERRL